MTKAARLREARVAWNARAQAALDAKDSIGAALYAGRAVGYRGFGFEELEESAKDHFGERFPPLFDPEEDSEFYASLRKSIDTGRKPLLPVWSTPVATHHKGQLQGVAYSSDGQYLASGGMGEVGETLGCRVG